MKVCGPGSVRAIVMAPTKTLAKSCPNKPIRFYQMRIEGEPALLAVCEEHRLSDAAHFRCIEISERKYNILSRAGPHVL